MQRFYRVRDLCSEPARNDKPARRGRYPFGPATLWRRVRAGTFPTPGYLPGGSTPVWPDDVLDAYDRCIVEGVEFKPTPRTDLHAADAARIAQRKAAGAASVAVRRAKRAEAAEGVAP